MSQMIIIGGIIDLAATSVGIDLFRGIDLAPWLLILHFYKTIFV
jgi:hypothetical protein